MVSDMYIVKIGEFYVKHASIYGEVVEEVELSKTLTHCFSEKWAKIVAKSLDGKLININEETTCDEESTNK